MRPAVRHLSVRAVRADALRGPALERPAETKSLTRARQAEYV